MSWGICYSGGEVRNRSARYLTIVCHILLCYFTVRQPRRYDPSKMRLNAGVGVQSPCVTRDGTKNEPRQNHDSLTVYAADLTNNVLRKGMSNCSNPEPLGPPYDYAAMRARISYQERR